MTSNKELVKTTTAMIRDMERKQETACWRRFFALEIDDRRLVEEMFGAARKKFPTRDARKTAERIHQLIRRNFEKEIDFMMEATKGLLRDWFFSGKEVFYANYLARTKVEQELILGALAEVFSNCETPEFRQAAVEIPQYVGKAK